MPRLSALRVGALERLAADLRFAPRARTIAIIRAAERLAPTISPDDAVDERDLIHALTAYRPDLEDPAVIPGDALRADLSALCERISDTAKINEREIPSAISIQSVAQRWNVSVKTVERKRREGLIAWRVRTQGGHVAVRITPEALTAFAAAGAPPTPSPRMPGSERRRLSSLAQRAQRRFNWNRTETARRLARRSGRSYETIRRLLAQELAPPAPPATARRRRDAHRRWLRAEPTAAIASAASRAPETVRRWIDQERRRAVLALQLPAPDPPIPDSALEAPELRAHLRPQPHRTAAEFVQAARTAPPANPALLRTLDTGRVALLLRARAEAQTPGRADDAETALRLARLVKHRLTDLHTRLTLDSIEAAVAGPLLRLPPPMIRALHAQALDAVLSAVSRHDPRSGSSVSGAINVALNRRLLRVAELAPARRALATANRAESPGARLDDWTSKPPHWPDPFAAPSAAPASDVDLSRWIALRTGADDRPPLTRDAAAHALEITTLRAAQLDRAARALPG